jgi:SAM-dependent methyltransferase
MTGASREDLVGWLRQLEAHPNDYKRMVLTYGASFFSDEVGEEVGITPANPPADVHSMVRQEFFAGDFYYCDMIVEALAASGLEPLTNGNYLDFGTSTGRVVRTMRAAFPQSNWHGCDPQETAIEWAEAHLDRDIRFFVSPLAPPLPAIGDAFFDGIFAISIWSHFSEQAALAWFSEAWRCLKPGGWLMFTTHGPNTLRHYAQHGFKLPDDLRRLCSELFSRGYAFEDVFGSAGDWGVPNTGWRMCYMLPSWVALNLVGKGWALHQFVVGRAALDQDLYLLVKTN